MSHESGPSPKAAHTFFPRLGTGSLLGGTLPGRRGMSKFLASGGVIPPIPPEEKSLISLPQNVHDKDKAVQCDLCTFWIHIK